MDREKYVGQGALKRDICLLYVDAIGGNSRSDGDCQIDRRSKRQFSQNTIHSELPVYRRRLEWTVNDSKAGARGNPALRTGLERAHARRAARRRLSILLKLNCANV